jgi:hypothetical protein
MQEERKHQKKEKKENHNIKLQLHLSKSTYYTFPYFQVKINFRNLIFPSETNRRGCEIWQKCAPEVPA